MNVTPEFKTYIGGDGRIYRLQPRDASDDMVQVVGSPVYYIRPRRVREAVRVLRHHLPEEFWVGLWEAVEARPTSWWAVGAWHFGQGMHIRNLLRLAGFGEEYLNVENLDDVYVDLVEMALEMGGHERAGAIRRTGWWIRKRAIKAKWTFQHWRRDHK